MLLRTPKDIVRGSLVRRFERPGLRLGAFGWEEDGILWPLELARYGNFSMFHSLLRQFQCETLVLIPSGTNVLERCC